MESNYKIETKANTNRNHQTYNNPNFIKNKENDLNLNLDLNEISKIPSAPTNKTNYNTNEINEFNKDLIKEKYNQIENNQKLVNNTNSSRRKSTFNPNPKTEFISKFIQNPNDDENQNKEIKDSNILIKIKIFYF